MDGHNNLQAGHKIYQLFSKRSYHPDKTKAVHMNVVFLLTDLKKFAFVMDLKWNQSEFVS